MILFFWMSCSPNCPVLKCCSRSGSFRMCRSSCSLRAETTWTKSSVSISVRMTMLQSPSIRWRSREGSRQSCAAHPAPAKRRLLSRTSLKWVICAWIWTTAVSLFQARKSISPARNSRCWSFWPRTPERSTAVSCSCRWCGERSTSLPAMYVQSMFIYAGFVKKSNTMLPTLSTS